MNKSAKEMFEELGYELQDGMNTNNRISYYKKCNVQNYPGNYIMFDLDYKVISKDYDTTIEEFKAIQQQIKELGWESDK